MELVFPTFVRASTDDVAATNAALEASNVPKKSLLDLVIEADGELGLVPQRERAKRLREWDVANDEGESRAEGGFGGHASESGAVAILSTRTSWIPPTYTLDHCFSAAFFQQFTDLHGLRFHPLGPLDTSLPPPPVFYWRDLRLPAVLHSSLQQRLQSRHTSAPGGARGGFAGPAGRRGSGGGFDADRGRRFGRGGGGYLPTPAPLSLDQVAKAAQLRELLLHAGTDADDDTPLETPAGATGADEGAWLRPLQQVGLSSMLMGHHTMLAGPHQSGKALATCLSLGLHALRTYTDDLAAEESTQREEGAEAEEAPPAESTASLPRAVLLVPSFNEVREWSAWLSDVFGPHAFHFFTISPDGVDVMPHLADAQKVAQEREAAHAQAEEEARWRAEAAAKEAQERAASLANLIEVAAADLIPAAGTAPPESADSRKGDDHADDETKSGHRHHHRRRPSSSSRHRRHRRSRSRSYDSVSTTRSEESGRRRSKKHERESHHSSSSRSGRRHERDRHRKHRRRESRDDSSDSDRDADRHSRHSRRRRRRHRTNSRSDSDEGEARRDHRSRRSRSRDAPVAPVDDVSTPQPTPSPREAAVTVTHAEDLAAAVATTPSPASWLPAYLRRGCPLLITTAQAFQRHMEANDGHCTSLRLEMVRTCAVLHLERWLQPPLMESFPPTYWLRLCSAMDVDCQFLFTMRRSVKLGMEFVRNTVLPDIGVTTRLAASAAHEGTETNDGDEDEEAAEAEASTAARLVVWEQCDETIWDVVRVDVQTVSVDTGMDTHAPRDRDGGAGVPRVSMEEIDIAKTVKLATMVLELFMARAAHSGDGTAAPSTALLSTAPLASSRSVAPLAPPPLPAHRYLQPPSVPLPAPVPPSEDPTAAPLPPNPFTPAGTVTIPAPHRPQRALDDEQDVSTPASAWQGPLVVVFTGSRREQQFVEVQLSRVLRESAVDRRAALLRVGTSCEGFTRGELEVLVVTDTQLQDTRETRTLAMHMREMPAMLVHFSLSRAALHGSLDDMKESIAVRQRALLGNTHKVLNNLLGRGKISSWILMTAHHMDGRVGTKVMEMLASIGQS